jgi:type VI secretion system Hcp family effector
MSFDAFIFIPGAKGESDDTAHKGWIELQEYGFGFEMATGSGSRSDSGPATTGRVKVSEFTGKKNIDIASGPLMLMVAQGQPIQGIKIELCRAVGKKEKFVEIAVGSAIITKCEISGSGGDELPTESLGLSAGTIEFKYYQFEKDSDKLVTKNGMKWSQLENKGSAV